MVHLLERVRVFSGPPDVAEAAAELFRNAAVKAVSERGRFLAALPGGRTPRLLYETLSSSPYREEVPWRKSHLFLVDERYVPLDHSDSNYRMIHDLLICRVDLAADNVHPYDTGLPALEAAASYCRVLERTIGGEGLTEGLTEGLDLVLLGMGEDGHVGSIFPGTAAVYVERRGALAQVVPQLDAWRLSLTLPEMCAARNVVFLVTGADKSSALADVATGHSGLPAGRVFPVDGTPVWLVDEPAAWRLGWAPCDGPAAEVSSTPIPRSSASADTVAPDTPSTSREENEATTPKRLAGESAAEEVESGMAVGLGTGSTARFATIAIGRRLAEGRIADVIAVPTSEATALLAEEHGIPLATLAEQPRLDLAIDGADEVSPDLDLIKGLGAALLREKIVAAASDRFVVVADIGKRVDRLGTKSPLPVAVVPFGWTATAAALRELDMEPHLRTNKHAEPVVTDDGLYLLDCRFKEGIEDAVALDAALRAIPGVVESGLFIGMAKTAYLGREYDVLTVHRPRRPAP